jgi:hypothetical protein
MATTMKTTGPLLRLWPARIGALTLAVSGLACGEEPPGPPAPADAAIPGEDGADARPAAAPLGLYCSPGVDPGGPLVTDFAAATFNGKKGRWRDDDDLTFFVYDYRDNGGSESSNRLEGDLFTFSGQVVPGAGESYAGGGMHFDSCVNTTHYTGVQFTLTGTSGGCAVYFDLQTYSQQTIRERGGCASYCYHFPRKVVTPRSAPITVLFSELEGTGIPSSVAAMASEIMGMRWQLELAAGQVDAGQTACAFNLSVDDVKFVK